MEPLTTVLIVSVIALLSYNIGKFVFKKDDEWERRAEALLDLSAVLEGYGLKDIPKVLRLLAIKDISGAVEVAKFYVQLVKESPEAVTKKFDEVFNRVLDAKIKSPESLALLKAKLAEVK